MSQRLALEFNETAGATTFIDSWGSHVMTSHNGATANGATWASPGTWTLTSPHSSTLDIDNTSDFNITFRIFMTGTPNTIVAQYYTSPGNGNYIIQVDSSGVGGNGSVWLLWGTSLSSYVRGDGALTPSAWNIVEIYRTGGVYGIKFNGVQQLTTDADYLESWSVNGTDTFTLSSTLNLDYFRITVTPPGGSITGNVPVTLTPDSTPHLMSITSINGNITYNLTPDSSPHAIYGGSIVGNSGVTLNPLSRLFEKVIFMNESISTTSSLLSIELYSILETLLISPVIQSSITTSKIINELIVLIDSSLLSFSGTVSESISSLSTLSYVIDNIERIVEFILQTNTIESKITAISVVNDLLVLVDKLETLEIENVNEVLGITTLVNDIYNIIKSIVEAIAITDSFTPSLLLLQTLNEKVVTINNLLSTRITNGLLNETIIISLPTIKGQDTYLAYLLSPETSSVTNYNNYNFNGSAIFNNKYLFFNDTGLYEYGGTTDDGSLIRSYIETVAYSFGTTNLKQVPSIYLGVSTTDSVILKVRVDGKGEIVYKLNKKTDYLQTQKIDIGKGLIGRYFQFEIITDADNFNMESIEFFPVELKRKL